MKNEHIKNKYFKSCFCHIIKVPFSLWHVVVTKLVASASVWLSSMVKLVGGYLYKQKKQKIAIFLEQVVSSL